MRRNRHNSRSGYTLLEVLVATTIMAIAVVGLLSNLSGSLSNASRLTDYDRAALLAKRTMDEIMTRRDVPKGTDLEGLFDPNVIGIEGGYRARITPYQRSPRAGAGHLGMDRYEVEVWWLSTGQRRSFVLEGYKAVELANEDLGMGTMVR
jgi:prepilin-type N-terminal cleavage/methylation domain-containing protein